MPFLYLSPSTQQFNPYVTTENEEYWMNRLADAMEPYLRASGINFTRNDPEGSAAVSIQQSNAGEYDFHLALHSNAAGVGNSGNVRGVDFYYYPTSREGLAMANILVDNLKPVYPLPDRVRALSTTTIGEVRRTKAPAVLAELGYHDNREDALWIENSLPEIAAALARGVTEYFGLPFIQPAPPRPATVTVQTGGLNLRNYPDENAGVYAVMPNGAQVTVYGEYDNWYVVEYLGTFGYARKNYIAPM